MTNWLEKAKQEFVAVQAINITTQPVQAEICAQLAQTAALIAIAEELRKMNERAEAAIDSTDMGSAWFEEED